MNKTDLVNAVAAAGFTKKDADKAVAAVFEAIEGGTGGRQRHHVALLRNLTGTVDGVIPRGRHFDGQGSRIVIGMGNDGVPNLFRRGARQDQILDLFQNVRHHGLEGDLFIVSACDKNYLFIIERKRATDCS